MNVLWLALGIILLTAGGEMLIRGALSAAKRLNVSPVLTGLVIVGFGTSAPELVVSVDAVLSDKPDIAIGNVVGSNIGNVLLILGVCALISPLIAKPLALRRDASTVIGASVVFLVLAQDAVLSRLDAIVLLLVLVIYLLWAYWSERFNHAPAAEVHEAEAEELHALPQSLLSTAAFILLGLLFLIVGSKVLLIGAVAIAQWFGVSEAAIGLTLVAVGTSLPELTVSVMAALRRHADVAVANILGSNIFNLLGILGVAALVHPLPLVERVQTFDQWIMLAAAVVTLIFLYTGRRLSRVEGGLLLLGYGLYLAVSFTQLSN